MQQGYLDQGGNPNPNQAITEMSEESYDSVIEQNIKKGFDIGYKGSRLFVSSRQILPYLTPANQKIPVWSIVGKFMK